jgi:uncharacterized alpha-E superfamily protein
MISRVAECCFWLGRYLERAEATARLLYITRNLSMDAEMDARQCWLPVIIVIGEEPQFVDLTTEHPAHNTSGEQVERYMTWDQGNLSSIYQSVAAARENARSIREVISLEVWEAINELYLWLGSEEARAEYAAARYSFYRTIRSHCQLTSGLLRSTMLHESPLNFIWLGMLLERAGQTARVVDVQHHALMLRERTHQVIETALWLSLLRACSGMEPFMKKNRGRVTGDAVAEFLIFEPNFPKSIAYSVHEAWCRFAAIRPPEETTLPGGQTLERLHALDRWVGEAAELGVHGDVHDMLTHVVDEVAAICEGLGRELFGHAAVVSMESAQ